MGQVCVFPVVVGDVFQLRSGGLLSPGMPDPHLGALLGQWLQLLPCHAERSDETFLQERNLKVIINPLKSNTH